MEKQQNKEALLKICRDIVNAPEGVINVLKRTPVCNGRMMKKIAKNTSDPQPLSTMLSTFGKGFPISIDAQEARKRGLPREYMSYPDTHQYGRVCAKLDAINWFIDNKVWEEGEKDELKESIDVLYKYRRAEVAEYYNYDWARSSSHFGTVYLTREVIPTNEVQIAIPQKDIGTYVLAAVSPWHHFDWNHLEQSKIEELQSLAKLGIARINGLGSQIRTLVNCLDPKYRMIPIATGMSMADAKWRFALVGQKWHIKVDKKTHKENDNTAELSMTHLGLCVMDLLKRVGAPGKIALDLSRMGYEKMSIREHLMQIPSNIVPIKVLKCLCNIEVTMASGSRSMEFFPRPSEVVVMNLQNMRGINFRGYQGHEEVNFTYKDIQGVFAHNLDMIYSIAVMKATKRDYEYIMGGIAEYIRLGWNSSNAKTMKQMREECFRKFQGSPWLMLNWEKRDWLKWATVGGEMGPMRIIDQIQHVTLDKIHGRIRTTPNNLGTYQISIQYATKRDSPGRIQDIAGELIPVIPPTFSEKFCNMSSKLLHYATPLHCLSGIYHEFIQERNWAQIRKAMVERQDFTCGNEEINVRISDNDKIQVSKAARNVLRDLMISGNLDSVKAYAAYCYMFARPDVHDGVVPKYVFKFSNSIMLDIGLASGEVMIVDQKMRFGNFIVDVNDTYQDAKAWTILPGWTVQLWEGEDVETRDLKNLATGKYGEGSRFKLVTETASYLVVKDGQAPIDLSKTMDRYLSVNQTKSILDRIKLALGKDNPEISAQEPMDIEQGQYGYESPNPDEEDPNGGEEDPTVDPMAQYLL